MPRLLVLLVFAASLAANLLSIRPGLGPEDDGETVAACVTFGLQHPPGYPIHTLLGALFVRLLPISAATSLAVFSSLLFAVAASIASATLYAGLPRDLARPWRALFSCVPPLFFALRAVPLEQSGSAKGSVYALDLLFFALLARETLPLLAEGVPAGAAVARRCGVLFGLALAHHWPLALTALPLLAPLRREPVRFAVFSLPPLLGYAYLPIAAAAGSGTDTRPADLYTGLVAYFFREQYAPGGIESIREVPSRLALFFGHVTRDLSLAIACGAFALETILRRRHKKPFVAFALLPLVPALSIVLGLDLNRSSFDPPKFLLRSDLLFYLLAAFALSRLSIARSARVPVALAAFPLAALLLLQAGYALAAQRSRHPSIAEAYAVDLLRAAPPGAVLLADDSASLFPLFHARYVQHLREDVAIVPRGHLDPRLRAKLRRFRSLVLPDVGSADVDGYALAFASANRSRPMFLVPDWKRSPFDAAAVPRGLLRRIDVPNRSSSPAAVPYPEDAWRQITFDPAPPKPGSRELLSSPERFLLACYAIAAVQEHLAFLARGQKAEAERAVARQRAIVDAYPYPEVWYRAGVTYLSARRPDYAIPYLEQAMRLAPNERYVRHDLAIAHNNLAGAFAERRDFSSARAELSKALEIDPLCKEARENLPRLPPN